MAPHYPAILLTLATGVCLTGCLTAPELRPPAPARPSASAPILPVSTPSTPVADPVLMIIGTVLGHCSIPGCEGTTTINRDGRYSDEYGPGTPKTGKIDPQKLETLAREIAKADFAQIKSVPFTGLCPTAVDGTEYIYTFHTANGKEEFSSCKVKIDYESPLFQAVDAVRKAIEGR